MPGAFCKDSTVFTSHSLLPFVLSELMLLTCLKDPYKIMYILLSLPFLSRPVHHPYFPLLSSALLVSFSVFVEISRMYLTCNARCFL